MVGNQQRKGRWEKEEDKILMRLVTEHSVDGEDIDWSVLEQNFKGTRDSKQIRERWVNHLNPSIKKRKFNDDEIKIIEEECSKHKFKWAKIAKKIPNATPLMIKNFYNNRLKKKNPANRKLSNSNTTSYTNTYTINNFNTSTTTTTPYLTYTYLNNSNDNPNNYDDEYLSVNDFSYYSKSNLSRSSSNSTNGTFVANPGLSRHSSTKTVSSVRTMVDPYLPSEMVHNEKLDPQNGKLDFNEKPDLQNGELDFNEKPDLQNGELDFNEKLDLQNGKLDFNEKLDPQNGGLDFLASVADFYSHVSYKDESHSPTEPKPEKMSIRNLIHI